MSKRVVIVDDHPMVRVGLIFALKVFPDLVVVGEARNGNEALQVCQEMKPDVVVMDLTMPEMDGILATAALQALLPAIKVIAITSVTTSGCMMRDVMRAGAVMCLQKYFSIDELATAIRTTG
jgi:DNA-binding NarL/FixJ family response regulator